MDINFLAVGLAALAAFFGGYLWYTVAFAKPWQRLIGLRGPGEEAASTAGTPGLGKLLIGSLVLELVMAFVLAWLIGAQAGPLDGLLTGLAVGAGVIAASFGVIFLFEGKPLKLWLIHAGFFTVVVGVMGLIIGAL